MRSLRTVAIRSSALGIVLMFISLLYAQHVLLVDYEAVNYGYPLPWLVHYIEGMSVVNMWLPNVVQIFADFILWLAVSFVLFTVLSSWRARVR